MFTTTSKDGEYVGKVGAETIYKHLNIFCRLSPFGSNAALLVIRDNVNCAVFTLNTLV